MSQDIAKGHDHIIEGELAGPEALNSILHGSIAGPEAANSLKLHGALDGPEAVFQAQEPVVKGTAEPGRSAGWHLTVGS